MNWEEYKTICNRPDVFSRELLRWTISQIEDGRHAMKLTEILRGTPVFRPVDSQNDARIDMFVMPLAESDVRGILDQLTATVFVKTGRYRHASIVWGEYLEYLQQGGTVTMNAQDRVTALMRAFDSKDLDGVAACFEPKAIYHNIPMEAVQGVEAIRASLAPFMGMASQIRFEVLRSAANGNVVMNERVDRFKIGDKWLAIAVMGVFEVGEQGITAWRDYFDLGQFQTQMAAITGS